MVYVSREKRIDDYITALEQEARRYPAHRVDTVYIGGGTPSVFEQTQLLRLEGALAGTLDLSGVREFTIEANPEDITEMAAQAFKSLGATRVSLGAQSFNEKYLRFLGREHDASTARRAVAFLRAAGFKNINIDLMFDLPGQTAAELQDDLRELTSLKSEHVSVYSLTVEPHSRFFVQGVKPPDSERQALNYAMVIRELEAVGLRQYEISNFAKPGNESQHNLNYWQSGNYIGLGVSAHSHVGGRRSWNVDNLDEYISRLAEEKSPEAGSEELSAEKRLLEALVFGLRMNAGVEVSELEHRFGILIPPEQAEQIRRFREAGFLHQTGKKLHVTTQGQQVLDELAVYLI